jgi:hypothetical protein
MRRLSAEKIGWLVWSIYAQGKLYAPEPVAIEKAA